MLQWLTSHYSTTLEKKALHGGSGGQRLCGEVREPEAAAMEASVARAACGGAGGDRPTSADFYREVRRACEHCCCGREAPDRAAGVEAEPRASHEGAGTA